MEMQKQSAFSAWLFLVKPSFRSIRNEVKDNPVYVQKRMEMQKESAFSAWLFLVKPPPLRPSRKA
jgi:hypothetical protein